jgi:hypothetical protein
MINTHYFNVHPEVKGATVDMATCHICGAYPLVLDLGAIISLFCDNGHEAVSTDNFAGIDDAIENWNEIQQNVRLEHGFE